MYRQRKSPKEHKEQKQKERKRGRPSGKNRVPLSLEERRARNAQYERERRNETTAAMTELAEAAGCDPSIKNTDLLRTVLAKINGSKETAHEENVDFLTRTNSKIRAQIAQLQNELVNLPGVDIWNHQDLLAPESDSEEETEELLSMSPTAEESPPESNDLDALLGPLTAEDNALIMQMMQELDYS